MVALTTNEKHTIKVILINALVSTAITGIGWGIYVGIQNSSGAKDSSVYSIRKFYLDNPNGDNPNFTKFIHGDLYAGHILTYADGNVCGIIDWSTARISDISQDFSGHLTVFGEESLKSLISEYEKQGGKIWNMIFEQAVERAAAAPLAYGYFAVETQDEVHINGAKVQLGVQR